MDVEPVCPPERLAHLWVGVRRVEDVVVEVATDLDLGEGDVLEPREGVGRQLRLGDGVVLELEVRVELHQRGPVGAGASAHGRLSGP